MSLLTERDWRTSYRHEDGDLIELFYNPALACAVQYDRMTGYFSADALALASRGIAALIDNDGLPLVGPELHNNFGVDKTS
jgi:hypothetical protein